MAEKFNNQNTQPSQRADCCLFDDVAFYHLNFDAFSLHTQPSQRA